MAFQKITFYVKCMFRPDMQNQHSSLAMLVELFVLAENFPTCPAVFQEYWWKADKTKKFLPFTFSSK